METIAKKTAAKATSGPVEASKLYKTGKDLPKRSRIVTIALLNVPSRMRLTRDPG